jgi:hypothetical protein
MRGFHIGQSRSRRWLTIYGATATIAALSALVGTARAQQAPAPLEPATTPAQMDVPFAPGGPRVDDLVAPLWLTLSGALFSQANVFSGCDSRLDASGNSVHGYAVQRRTFLRLGPQFTLHRFSMAGCAVDSGSGAAFSYAMPIGKRTWLLHSAGFFRQPTPSGSTSPLLTAAARVDLVQKLPLGRTLSFGLGTRSSADQFHALHLGGSF